METLFSARNGYEVRGAPQLESMDENLRISLFNVLYNYLGKYGRGTVSETICKDIWTELWHKAIDEFPYDYWDFYEEMKRAVRWSQWYKPYDLVEYLADDIHERFEDRSSSRFLTLSADGSTNPNEELENAINYVLESERSGYRMLGRRIVPITNEAELLSLEQSAHAPDSFSGVRLHICKAIEHLSNKPEPDYANTAKEAVSAAESAARRAAGLETGTLDDALKVLKKRTSIHPALLKGWSNLYGFAGDEGGIRHASNSDAIKVDFALAKYMLVSCSAFSNYLIELDSGTTGDD